jgi:hypothetical protein
LTFTTIVVIVTGVRGIGDNKGEKKLLITNGKVEFNPKKITFGNNFKIEYEQFLRHTMEANVLWF